MSKSQIELRCVISITAMLFALVVAAVLVIIIDFDMAQQGIANVVHKPLIDLRRQMGAPVP